ncbi:MAG: hypothetical protein HY738_08950 [Bacteroidia bacterium]|nr:hypothetical protein [Bacteroidia bacterium]
MEALIAPSSLKIFRERGIDVERTFTNIKIKGKKRNAEFDVVLGNGREIVIIEVKTTMNVEKVNEFLEKLSRIREYFPEYSEKQIYGAVAGIKYEENSDKYAYRNGLFVIVNSGEGLIKIANSRKFKPAAF